MCTTFDITVESGDDLRVSNGCAGVPCCEVVPNHQTKPVEFKGYTLNPFQVEAADAIEAGHNVLLAAPTGAGKTLVAEYAIDHAVRQGKRAIYTSPIKALSNQKFRDMQEEFGDVGLMTGDVTINADATCVIIIDDSSRSGG